MAFEPNGLFFEMCDIFVKHFNGDDKVIIANEGGSRSSKTWDTFHFIYTFCDHNRNEGNDIYILRDTLTNCRDYTFKDFKKCMEVIGARLNYFSEGQKPYVNIFGNNIYFRGMDSEDNAEGYPSDIIFVNEALETEKTKVAGLKMRCRKLMIMDWNPKFTKHWCFDMEGQINTFFTRSNYKDNKHLQKSVVNDIESYEPWQHGSYYIEDYTLMYKGEELTDKNQPPQHLVNCKNNTADEFRWKVYGLGLRGAMEGVILPNINYIESFPEMEYIYGNDFGFTNDPNATVKYAEDEHNIFFEVLCYQSIDTDEALSGYFETIGIEKDKLIICDSSDKYTGENKGTVEMVKGLRRRGYKARKVKKTKSIMYWLGSMKQKKIHCVKNHLWKHAKIEQQNYRFKKIMGININQPIDGFDHIISSVRYCHIAYNEPKMELTTDQTPREMGVNY